jgi:hypothetical protein
MIAASLSPVASGSACVRKRMGGGNGLALVGRSILYVRCIRDNPDVLHTLVGDALRVRSCKDRISSTRHSAAKWHGPSRDP